MDGNAVWAVEQFGKVEVGDKRRTQGAVELGQAMGRRAADGLAKQMGDWNGQRGSYRRMDNKAVSPSALSEPHWQQTRAKAGQSGPVVLMVQAITELDYSGQSATEGLGPIGDHQGRGLLAHHSLAVMPNERRVVGLAYPQVWTRTEVAHKKTESRAQRQGRADRQSQRWVSAVESIGRPPTEVRWVPVGDRDSDVFGFFEQVKALGVDFCIRIVQNRRLQDWTQDDPQYLIDPARQLPARTFQRRPARPTCWSVGSK